MEKPNRSFILKTKTKVAAYLCKLQAKSCSFFVQIFEHCNLIVQILFKGLRGEKKVGLLLRQVRTRKRHGYLTNARSTTY